MHGAQLSNANISARLHDDLGFSPGGGISLTAPDVTRYAPTFTSNGSGRVPGSVGYAGGQLSLSDWLDPRTHALWPSF